jgi:outer membrane protein
MMSNGTLKLIALSLLTASLAAAQDTTIQLTLDEAITIGKEHSRLLKIADAKVDQARARASEANTTLLPSLKLTGSYQRLSDVPDFAVTLPSTLPPPLGGSSVTLAPTVENTYNARVSLQQPLFTGFKLRSNAKMAEYLADANQFERQNEQSDLVLTITTAYWTLYQTMETKRFMDENVSRLQSFVNDTKNLLNAGMVTKNDLLKVSLQLNDARLSQIDATNDVQLAMMNLNNVLGQPLDTQLRLASTPAGPAKGDADSMNAGSSMLAQALHSRADLLGMQSRVEAAKAGVTAAQGDWWPQLFLVGGYTYARPNQRYQPTLDEFKGTWDVGVQLQLNLWNWGATSDQTEQASAQLKQNELTYEQMKENISLDVKRQQLATEQSREKVSVAMLAIDQAEENQRTTNDKYKQGLATASDLLDANVALLQAKTNYSGALVQHEIAIARLHKAVGAEE